VDKGVSYVLKNFEMTLNLISEHEEYKKLFQKVSTEFRRVKTMKFTGDMYNYFLKFKDGKNKHADEFKFLSSYGILTNEELADYLKAEFPDEIKNVTSIENLDKRKVYSGNEIVTLFGVSYMGGMRRSVKNNILVLTALHGNALYDDQWNGSIFNYTGMGKSGDQSINFMQNITLAESRANGTRVFLFESYRKNEYYFDGEVELASDPFYEHEIGDDGIDRIVIKFPLRIKDGDMPAVVAIDDVEVSEQIKRKVVQKQSAQEVKEKAKAAEKKLTTKRNVKTEYISRNEYIAQHTKDRANGHCDLCGCEAPFSDSKGTPFLESHHVVSLSNGGPDAIYNTVALCPNCHRKMHVLHKAADVKKLQDKIRSYLEDDKDTKDIAELDKIRKNK